MLSTYTEIQQKHAQARSVLKSHSLKCWKSPTDVKVNESGGRPGSGSASDEPKSGAAWRGINHELTPLEEDSRERNSDYVKTSDRNILHLACSHFFLHICS